MDRIDLHACIDPKRAIGEDLIETLARIVFILDFADDLFKHVLNGDDTYRSSILVHDHRKRDTLLLHILQEVADAPRLGRIIGWTNQMSETSRVGGKG
jgi:hypothetical protein